MTAFGSASALAGFRFPREFGKGDGVLGVAAGEGFFGDDSFRPLLRNSSAAPFATEVVP